MNTRLLEKENKKMKQLVIRDFNTNEIIVSAPTKRRSISNCREDVLKLLNISNYFVTGVISPNNNTLHYVARGYEFTMAIES